MRPCIYTFIHIHILTHKYIHTHINTYIHTYIKENITIDHKRKIHAQRRGTYLHLRTKKTSLKSMEQKLTEKMHVWTQ